MFLLPLATKPIVRNAHQVCFVINQVSLNQLVSVSKATTVPEALQIMYKMNARLVIIVSMGLDINVHQENTRMKKENGTARLVKKVLLILFCKFFV